MSLKCVFDRLRLGNMRLLTVKKNEPDRPCPQIFDLKAWREIIAPTRKFVCSLFYLKKMVVDFSVLIRLIIVCGAFSVGLEDRVHLASITRSNFVLIVFCSTSNPKNYDVPVLEAGLFFTALLAGMSAVKQNGGCCQSLKIRIELAGQYVSVVMRLGTKQEKFAASPGYVRFLILNLDTRISSEYFNETGFFLINSHLDHCCCLFKILDLTSSCTHLP